MITRSRDLSVRGSSIARHADAMRLVGHTVVAGGFSADEIQDFGRRLNDLLRAQADEFGAAENGGHRGLDEGEIAARRR